MGSGRTAGAGKAAALASAAVIAAGAGGGIAVLAQRGQASTAAVTTTVIGGTDVATTGSSIGAIYKTASAGVVELAVTDQRGGGEGSGFVLDSAGHIVTNQHVVDGATSITAKFADGTSAVATVVGSDASADIAVLKVDVAASELHPLSLGSSSSVQVGEGVLAIGSPFGLQGSLTVGIVSALGRTIDAPDGSKITGTIQTDAAINPGNSGGPLLDADGAVIGVNAQIESSSSGNEGVGFAIRVDTVKQVLGRLLGGAST